MLNCKKQLTRHNTDCLEKHMDDQWQGDRGTAALVYLQSTLPHINVYTRFLLFYRATPTLARVCGMSTRLSFRRVVFWHCIEISERVSNMRKQRRITWWPCRDCIAQIFFYRQRSLLKSDGITSATNMKWQAYQK